MPEVPFSVSRFLDFFFSTSSFSISPLLGFLFLQSSSNRWRIRDFRGRGQIGRESGFNGRRKDRPQPRGRVGSRGFGTERRGKRESLIRSAALKRELLRQGTDGSF